MSASIHEPDPTTSKPVTPKPEVYQAGKLRPRDFFSALSGCTGVQARKGPGHHQLGSEDSPRVWVSIGRALEGLKRVL